MYEWFFCGNLYDACDTLYAKWFFCGNLYDACDTLYAEWFFSGNLPYILAYKSVFWELNFGSNVYVRLIGAI
jgi:hypothetical protein